jgi:two-component system cell cycle response regulator
MSIKNNRTRLLVIDDSSTVRITARKFFGTEFDILLATDGADGLNTLEADDTIDIVFTDLVMPVMDGFEFLKRLRSHKKAYIRNLPVVVMTGAENPDIAKEKALSFGATDFITKPFENVADIRILAKSYVKIHNEKNREHTITIDALTGMLNQSGFNSQLDKEIAFTSRHRYNISLMTIEIDRYKELFISMGRSSTEILIKRIAEVITNNVRKEDSIARTGLAQFTLSVPLLQQQSTLEMANKICLIVETIKAKLNGKTLKLTVSIGICTMNGDDEVTSDTLNDISVSALKKAHNLGVSQIYSLSANEYHETHASSKKRSLSLDALIDNINNGKENEIAKDIDEAIEQLQPLIAFLSNAQKQRLISLLYNVQKQPLLTAQI